jgi:lipoic acid synthetase
MSQPGDHPAGLRGAAKVARIPVKVVHGGEALPKPPWLRVRHPGAAVQALQSLLREERLHTVCEEAMCPNIGECFAGGTATFMVLGAVCTRRCPFCDVAHGRPEPPDAGEPQRLARTAQRMGLRYVVITSVDRDDLKDGGALHFVDCINALRATVPGVRVEILTPDFRGREARALDILGLALPDVFNHNLETVPRLYRAVRPGADYAGSLQLLAAFARRYPQVPTKAGLMLGLGETDDEVLLALADLRDHGCRIVTLGQYLAPSPAHLPVARYVSPDEFDRLAGKARQLGFDEVVAGPLVRSSYHADRAASSVVPDAAPTGADR